MLNKSGEILKEMFQLLTIEYNVSCGIVIYGLYYVEVYPLYAHFLEGFNHKWMLNLSQAFSCIYWDDHIIFPPQFVNVVYRIDWFADIEPSMHPWDKSHLIMVYMCNVLLNSICWFFLRIFVSLFISDIGLWFLYSHGIFIWFWYQGDTGLIEWVQRCFFLFSFLE